ncbi:MAG: hypothetical protein ACOZAA_01445 [Pseudomonadota bacterium]
MHIIASLTSPNSIVAKAKEKAALRKILIVGLFVRVFLNSAFAEDNAPSACAEIAALEDSGGLARRQVVPGKSWAANAPGQIEIDLDGDGVKERFEATSRGYEIEGRLLQDIAPEYKSVTANHEGIIEIDGAYFGVTRDIDLLSMVWRLNRDAKDGSLQGAPECFFDRDWKEVSGCEKFNNADFNRIELERPKKIAILNGWEKPDFLSDVFDPYYGIKPLSETVAIDIDNDGEPESVKSVLIHTFAPRYGRYNETPVIMTDDNAALAPTFQNARLIQHIERETLGGIDFDHGVISFLISKRRGEVFIDNRSHHVPLSGGSPRKVFRQVYRLNGAWIETICRADFSWSTVFTMRDLR